MSGEQVMYAVTSGSDSDYTVLCVCASKEDAEAVAVKVRGARETWRSDAEVTSFPLVSADVEQITSLRLSAEVWDNGTTSKTRESTYTEWPFDTLYHGSNWRVHWRWCRPPVAKGKGGRIDVQGTDHALVRKVFSEKRAQLIAGDGLRASNEKQGGRR